MAACSQISLLDGSFGPTAVYFEEINLSLLENLNKSLLIVTKLQEEVVT